ncbi:MAG: Gfo/Idh/MocA family oxidoreductase [Kiritimatiellae bacterium]|nr:Gfo/Idh/MocA family oxidoreductase [Kiritimatiellia bacterium]
MMSDGGEIGIGIVGLGFMGVTHLRHWMTIPGVRVSALCDAKRLPADGDFSTVAGNIGSGAPLKVDPSRVRMTARFEELLADPEVQLVDICVPTVAHKPLALAALRAGKHVVCEKPLARTAADAYEIAQSAESSQRILLPAMVIRFWPEYRWLKHAIADRRYGEVIAARFTRLAEPPTWSPDFMDGARSGGALLDLHIHDVDFIQHCFGPPLAVCAVGRVVRSGAVDHVAAVYRLRGGAAVSAEGGWVMTPGSGFVMSWQVVWERASAEYDCRRGAESLRLIEAGRPPRTIVAPGPDGYRAELEYAVECIRTGRRPATVTAREAAHAVAICEAEEASIRRGGEVVPALRTA